MRHNPLFIGRTEEIARLQRDVFDPPTGDYGSCIALCGPHGIGKTFLLNHLIRKFEEEMDQKEECKAFCFFQEIHNSQSEDPLTDFKYHLLSVLADTLTIDMMENALKDFQNLPKSKYLAAKRAVENLKKAYEKIAPQNLCAPNSPQYIWWRTEINKCFEPNLATSVFRIYTLLGFRIILILDEFDRSEKGFPTGDIFEWLFSLTDKGGKGLDLNLSIVVVSRRRPSTFVGNLDDGSDFEAAFHPMVLSGFSNQELNGENGYFASFGTQYCDLLTEEVRQKILFYCGRHPGLLMDMREECLRSYENPLDIDTIWNRNEKFSRVYQKMCEQMDNYNRESEENESFKKGKACKDGEITLMDAFIYQFVYFAGTADTVAFKDPDQQLYVDKLVNAGFAIKPDWTKTYMEISGVRYYPDIFVLSGTKDQEDAVKPLICEPLSPFFLTYVERSWNPDKRKGAAQHLGVTERALRAFIEKKLKSRYSDDWHLRIKAALDYYEDDPKRKEDSDKRRTNFMRSLERLVKTNHYDGDISNLNVLGFVDYQKILEFHWDSLFEDAFSAYTTPDKSVLTELRQDFKFLYDCRNAKAHENLKVLSADSIKRVQQICNRLDQIMEEELQSEPVL